MKRIIKLTAICLIVSILTLVFASCTPAFDSGSDDTPALVEAPRLPHKTKNASFTADELPELVESMDFGEFVEIESVSAVYISQEYVEELAYNSIDNFIMGYSATELSVLDNEAWFFSYDNGEIGISVVDRNAAYGDYVSANLPKEQSNALRNLAIGGGVILLCCTLSVFGGPVLSCIALSAAKGAALGSLVGAAVYGGVSAATYRISEGTWDGALEAMIEPMSEGFLVGSITGALTGALTASNCFTEGTLIATAGGMLAIEAIRSGMLVACSDDGNVGVVEYEEVVNVFSRQVNDIYTVQYSGYTLECTAEHPFYVIDQGWKDASNLSEGDKLVSVDGSEAIVESVTHRHYDDPVTVYNFEVDEEHTYYTGDLPVLVHNSCLHTSKEWNKIRKDYWKEQGKYYNDNFSQFQNSKGALNSLSGNYKVTTNTVDRMLAGKAPIGIDGKSVQLHHTKGISVDIKDFVEITRTDHYANYAALHPWVRK